MNVKIRKHKLAVEGRYSLYLDIYANGKQWQETLKLYIEPEKGHPVVKQMNKQTMEVAKKVQARRLLEIQNNGHGFKPVKRTNQTFNEFVKGIWDERKKTGVNFDGWDSTMKHLNAYDASISFSDITVDFLEGFKSYLLSKVKPNTALSYFSKIKAAIHRAFRERLILDNPADLVKSPKEVDTKREYLTTDEVKKLVDTPCRYDVLKRAFLFSCLTGLRWSDINKLTWREIREIDGVYHILYTQKKTRNAEVLPISESAYKLLGHPKDDSEKVFVGLKYSAYLNVALQTWVNNADIKKHITFHCARHTNAVLLLNGGVDIFTVSKMLGHRELKTTQIYAKVINQTKVAAIDKLPQISL